MNILRESMKMAEKCKTCKNIFNEGIWLAPQFSDEKVLLFCSERCKYEYIKAKLQRIKFNYPKYYEKVVKSLKEGRMEKSLDPKLWAMIKEMSLEGDKYEK